jgi:hypothetical protein
MKKRTQWFIAAAALLVSGGALMPATVANEWGDFRPCGNDEVLYDPLTDDIAVYYGPVGKYIVFPSAGQLRYLGRSRAPDFSNVGTIGGGGTPVDGQWRIATADRVKELRATGRCKTSAGG